MRDLKISRLIPYTTTGGTIDLVVTALLRGQAPGGRDLENQGLQEGQVVSLDVERRTEGVRVGVECAAAQQHDLAAVDGHSVGAR
ncbi:hypothetical protein [Streptomyces sp. NPDC091209]|uniref:hypothetical protein n=1 Tax=Streptomyces sp. NPDC091209 TaxID=3365974 RepID=UPI00382F4032